MNHHLQSRWKPLAGGGRKRFGSSGHGFRNVGHVKKKIRPTQRKCRFRSHSPLIKRRERERLSSGGRLIVVSCGVPLPTRSLSRWARASFHERSRPGMAAFFGFCCFCSREREREAHYHRRWGAVKGRAQVNPYSYSLALLFVCVSW